MIDTSSIIDLRHLPGKNDRSRSAVFDALSELVEQGRLFYPPQVLAEVLRFGASVAQKWVKDNEGKATKYKPVYADIKPILARVRNLIDYSKPSPTDQGDRCGTEARSRWPPVNHHYGRSEEAAEENTLIIRSRRVWLSFGGSLRLP